MPRLAVLPLCQTPPEHDPEQEMLAFSAQTLRTVLVARALSESRRPIDLQGLQEQAGLLCAKALDLPVGRAGFAKAELQRLVREIDALRDTMRTGSA